MPVSFRVFVLETTGSPDFSVPTAQCFAPAPSKKLRTGLTRSAPKARSPGYRRSFRSSFLQFLYLLVPRPVLRSFAGSPVPDSLPARVPGTRVLSFFPVHLKKTLLSRTRRRSMRSSANSTYPPRFLQDKHSYGEGNATDHEQTNINEE